MLAGLIQFLTGTVLPVLGVAALSGLASTGGVQKLIGNGLYLNPFPAVGPKTGPPNRMIVTRMAQNGPS